MPPEKFARLGRIKAVEREHSAARLGIGRLREQAGADPSILGKGIGIVDVRLAEDRLEGTYLIRLFAEFEAGLRRYWPTARATDPPSRTRDLLDGVASGRKIPEGRLGQAHAVRERRNRLVHETTWAAGITLAGARHDLCAFLSYLPDDW